MGWPVRGAVATWKDESECHLWQFQVCSLLLVPPCTGPLGDMSNVQTTWGT